MMCLCVPTGSSPCIGTAHPRSVIIIAQADCSSAWPCCKMRRPFAMSVALIGTLDTKGDEVQFVRERLNEQGVCEYIIDAGVLGPVPIRPDISREEVFQVAGTSLAEVQRERDRGRAIQAAAKGVTKIVLS